MKWLGLIALAGMGGTLLRYGIGLSMQRASSGFPWNTLLINALGSLALGFIYKYYAGTPDREQLRLVLGVGFCGAFTTFSTFSLETAHMLEDGLWTRAFAYVIGSVVISFFAIIGGFQLAAFTHR